MRTRGRPNGGTWPKPGPLLHQTQTIEGQSYTSALSAGEKSHFAECALHFGTIPWVSWDRRARSQHGIWKYPHPHSLQARCAATLICGNRCARPIFRIDTRDEQWYCCDDHDILREKRRPRLLELPGEIRNEIYKHAFPPFLGLFPWQSLDESSIRLLRANKQVYEEVISLMYGTKPLRLRFEEDDLALDSNFYNWDGQHHRIRYDHERGLSASALLRFLGTNAFDYVREIEIYVDLDGSGPAERSILRDFADALRERRTRQRRLTIKFTAATLRGEGEEVDFFRFLQALRGVPEFRDVIFEVADLGQCLGQRKGEIEQHLVQRAIAMRDSLLQGQKRKWERVE